jgi:hypothetical protein
VIESLNKIFDETKKEKEEEVVVKLRQILEEIT